MKHAHCIKMRAALGAAFGMICLASVLASPSAWAQSGCFIDKNGVRACPVGPDPGGASAGAGGGCPAPCDGGLLGDLFRGIFSPGASTADKADQQARAANEQGVQAYNRGDWTAAAAYFQQALQSYPNDPTYLKNLANAQANLANQQAKEKAEREAAERQRQNRAAANNMQQSIQNFAQTLNASPISGGLDFDARISGSPPDGNHGGLDFTASVAPNKTTPASHTDTSVVDARVPRDGAYLTDQVPELKNSPAADRISKGFQAVINRDWPVALAWWQQALQRDPGNAALKRSVELAQWMVDKRKANAAAPVTPLGAAIHSAARGDHAGAIRQFELVKAENPASAPHIDDMINALRQRQAKDARDAKAAAYWSGEIKKGTQKMVDEMFEAGMNRLSIGDEKGAQEAFNDADFFGGSNGAQPSQLPAPKTGKSPASAPVFKTLPDGKIVQLPQDSDTELLFSPNAQPPAPGSGTSK
jgi:tetratricopeptide (TPR) repeat protein